MKIKIWLLVLVTLYLQVKCTSTSTVMSIDLGSEWIKIGVISPGIPLEIVLNKESKRKSRACIGFKNEERLFGDEADNLNTRFPGASFGYLTDLIGKEIDNPVVQLYRTRFPFINIVGDKLRNTVVFQIGNDSYSVEELVAQLIQKAHELTELYTGQAVRDVVLVVPSYFGQAEREALVQIVKLSGLKLLQLINDHSAIALNYAVFRKSELFDKPQTVVFFDVGAYKTTASVVSYKRTNNTALKEGSPLIETVAVAYDRTVGGLEIQTRLQNYLAKKFNEMKISKSDIFKNKKAMAKLFKEASRVKIVLSANTETYAQVESLVDEIDFKLKVTRQDLELLSEDIISKITSVYESAIKMAKIQHSDVTQVILFGGGSRMPKVQEALKSITNMELGKSLNSDEAATLGAVYKGAELVKGYKVTKFLQKDVVLFPLEISFFKTEDTDRKMVVKTLYGLNELYPQKKIITINKVIESLHFNLSYSELKHLDENEVERIGNTNLLQFQLKNISDIVDHRNASEIKISFILDNSGVIKVLNADLIVEAKNTPDSNDELNTNKTIPSSGGLNESSTDEIENIGNSTEKSASTNRTNEDEQNVKNKTTKINIKDKIESSFTVLYTLPISGESYKQAESQIFKLNERETKQKNKENAMNLLESFIIDTKLKLTSPEYTNCATTEEIDLILNSCSEHMNWLYEDGADEEAHEYEKRYQELTTATNDIFTRVLEQEKLPEAIKTIENLLNNAKEFLKTISDYPNQEDSEQKQLPESDIKNLENAINTTEEWITNRKKSQEQLKCYEPATLTVQSIAEKVNQLDNIMKNLVNKLYKMTLKKPQKKEPEEEKIVEKDSNATQENVQDNKDHTEL